MEISNKRILSAIVASVGLFVGASTTSATLLLQYKASNYNEATGVWVNDPSLAANTATVEPGWGGSAKPTLTTAATPNGSSAVTFTAASQTLHMATNLGATLPSDAGFTVMAYAVSDSGNGCIIGLGGFSYRLNLAGQQNAQRTGAASYGNSTGPVPQNAFSSFGASGINGIANSGIYTLNGNADGTVNPASAFTDSGASIIGAASSFKDQAFTGQIAEIRVYNTALTLAEQQAVHAEFVSSYVTAVPEPTSAVVIAIVGGVLTLARRRGQVA